MNKLLVLTSALMLLGAAVASAAAPGSNLGWNNCATTSASQNLNFTCDDNFRTFNMVGSFQLQSALPDFVGLSAVIDVATGGPSVPPWFQFATGGCREGALGMANVGSLGGCVNTYAGTAGQGGGMVIDPGAGPNKFRIRADWARAEATSLAGNTLYSAFVLSMNSSNTYDDGFTLVCIGCQAPACYVLNKLEAFGFAGDVRTIEAADVRNWATWQGGGVPGSGCPGETPSRSATWGAVKALYR